MSKIIDDTQRWVDRRVEGFESKVVSKTVDDPAVVAEFDAHQKQREEWVDAEGRDAEVESDPEAIFERHASQLRVGDEIWIGDSEGPGGIWADVLAVRLSDRPVVHIWWARDDIDEGQLSRLGDETVIVRRDET